MTDYSVKEAAAALGVSAQHVRRLIRSGTLPAKLIGNVWVLPADAVRERSAIDTPAGRPLSAETAWRVLQLVDLTLVGSALDTVQVHVALGELAGSRHQRRRLRNYLAHAPDVGQWDVWLRRRARRKIWWVHPAAVTRLDADARVHLVRPPAALWPEGASRYVSATDESDLASTFAAKPASDGNVWLLLFDPDIAPGRIPDAAAAVDLLVSPEARQQHAARRALADAQSRLLAELERP